MVSAKIDGNDLVFDISLSHKIFALKSQMRIPLDKIVEVSIPENLKLDVVYTVKDHNWRVAGSNIPYLYRGGTFIEHGKKVFWDVHNTNKDIQLILDNDFYAKVYIEVDNPQEAVVTINKALKRT
ncbi:MAG: hypothetical protein LBT66_01985 [Methanobrevibacter sp.]|jgi:hypothetical protein|nr:hypothetical protein [Candidatus Methanovirga meridionalis]